MTTATTDTSLPAATARDTSKAMLWTGRVLTTLVVLFMLFDAYGKLAKVAPVAPNAASVSPSGMGEARPPTRVRTTD